MSEAPFHEPGVYFGLDADTYHADESLGSTSLKRLLTSGPDYWWSSAKNPARPDDFGDTPSLLFGRAAHSVVLDGREEFDKLYLPEPDPEGLLVTASDLNAFLADRLMEENTAKSRMAFPRANAVKAEKAAFIIENWPDARVLDFIKADAEAAGQVFFDRETYNRIVASGAMVSANPALSQAFSGGASEVSVFWLHEMPDGPPIRCKARFDHLKVRAIADLKTIRNIKGLPFPQACRQAIANFRYDVQASHYMEGRMVLPQLVADGKVFGEHDPEWLARVAASEECAFVFCFLQATGAPMAYGVQLSPGNPILEIGRSSADLALWTFQDYSKRFAPDEAWVLREPISELALEEMPGYFGR